MKRNFAIGILAVSTLAAAGRALAEQPAVRANVPFEFSVGDRLLPAGVYTISSPEPGVMTVRGDDGHFWVATTTTHSNQESAHGGELIFDRYGDKYFLHEILDPNIAGLNVKVPKSKLEKQVQIQEAKYGGEPRVTLLASR